MLGYDELLAEPHVPDGPFCIIAESFSGPLAVLLTRKYAMQVRGMVLAASFVRSPSPLFVRFAAAAGAPLFHLRSLHARARRGRRGKRDRAHAYAAKGCSLGDAPSCAAARR